MLAPSTPASFSNASLYQKRQVFGRHGQAIILPSTVTGSSTAWEICDVYGFSLSVRSTMTLALASRSTSLHWTSHTSGMVLEEWLTMPVSRRAVCAVELVASWLVNVTFLYLGTA